MRGNLNQLARSLAGLPGWIQIWLFILVATNLSSLAFLETDVGRWTAVAFAVVAGLNLPLMVVQGGLTRLLSLPHFVWAPLLYFLYVRLGHSDAMSLHGPVRSFATLVFVVNGISLLFDIVEVRRWLRGQREVLGLAAPSTLRR